MRQKIQHQNSHKNYILYKGHTGWQVKVRLFGTLLVGLSAFALTEDVHPVTAQAATATPASGQVVSATDESKTTAEPQPSDPMPAAIPNSDSAGVAATKPANAEAPSAAPATENSHQYPVLSEEKAVNVGTDTAEVDLSADQIAQHFTATVENRGNSDQDDDPSDNVKTEPIQKDGTVALTSNAPHDYYQASGERTSVTGHQAAHVSFEHEIDFGHNFSMSGALGIGSKTSGADSVGFIFAPGDPAKATQGGSGGKLGLGGLSNAFGFVYDQYANVYDYNDPSAQPYVGWRTTDAYGTLQRAASSDWESASQLGLSRGTNNSLNAFTMDYDATTQVLTVTMGGGSFTRKITDTKSGYAISVAASTGGSWNDYAARIDKFSYTPKTIGLGINLVDSADDQALLDQTQVSAIANIGDTVSVFSTQAAAQRAVRNGEVDPALVAVLPTDSAGNLYVIDGAQTITNNTGKVHYVGGAGNQAIADDTYYTYTVQDGDGQQMTVPVRLAFQAVVTPTDAQTGQPIAGLAPVTVTAVDGEPSLVEIPGYTPTKVVLAAPVAGEKTAQDNLPIDQTSTDTATTTTTTDDTAVPVSHYYTATGTTVDGQTVAVAGTAGTGQAIAAALDQRAPYTNTTGEPITSGGVSGIGLADYYWSGVGTAQATDALTEATPQNSGSLLVPTTATLTYWDKQAKDNQALADQYQTEAQKVYGEFMQIAGLTSDQKTAADDLLATIQKVYQGVHDSDVTAQKNFEGAQTTGTAAPLIVADGQDGYAALKVAHNLLAEFKVDLTQLTTTNEKAQGSLASLPSWTVTYGQSVTPTPQQKVALGTGFGTVTAAQQAQIATYLSYYNQLDQTTAIVPQDVGQYVVKLTDEGRAYLKKLAPTNENAGLYVPGMLTIAPLDVQATVNPPASMTYGDALPALSGTLTALQDLSQVIPVTAAQRDFAVTDDQGNVVTAAQLQAGGTYTVGYTQAAQDALKKNENYKIASFGTARLTVTPRPITVTAQQHGKTYGTLDDPQLDLTSDSAVGLVNGDQLKDLNIRLVRATGEHAGDYAITVADPTATSGNSNYQVTVLPGTFTIAKLPITVQVGQLTKTYGAVDPDLTALKTVLVPGTPLVNGDDLSALGITLNRPVGEDAGTYEIGGTPQDSDYKTTIIGGTLTIMKRPVTVTATSTTKIYGADDPVWTLTPDAKQVLVAGDDLADLDVVLKRDDDSKNVGKHTITGTSDSHNYQVFVNSGNLTITPRDITLDITSRTKTYGDQDPELTVTVPAAAQQTLSTTGDSLAKLGLVLKRESGEDAKGYTITGASDNRNYNVMFNSGMLTINRRPVTVTAADVSKAYGEVDPTLILTDSQAGLVNGDSVTALDVTLKRDDTSENVGKYTITGTSDSQNYLVTVNPGNLTITPRNITLDITSLIKVYGDQDPELTVTVPAAAQQTLSATGDSLATLGLALQRESGEDVKTYAITGASDNRNYNVMFNSGMLTINRRPVTVTVASTTKVYGTADPVWTLTPGAKQVLVADDELAALGVVLKRKNTRENVGDYQISGDSNSENYHVTFNPGTLTITPRAIVITPDSQTKVYGHSDRSLTYTLTKGAIMGNDDLQVTLTRQPGENVGDYEVTGQTLNPNYQVDVTAGKWFHIMPAIGQVTIGSATMTYGDKNVPVLTSRVMVDGHGVPTTATDLELVAPDGQVVAPVRLRAGRYQIRLTAAAQARLGLTNPNDQFMTSKTGILTVNPRKVTVKIADQEMVAGEAVPQNTVQVVAGTLGTADTLADLDLHYQEPTVPTVKTYLIAAQSANPNYQVTVIDGHLTVLGRTSDANGVTVTHKDETGHVVTVTRDWPDHSQTRYAVDPKTGVVTVEEWVAGQLVDQQVVPVPGRISLTDGQGTVTIVTVQDVDQPMMVHNVIAREPSATSNPGTVVVAPQPQATSGSHQGEVVAARPVPTLKRVALTPQKLGTTQQSVTKTTTRVAPATRQHRGDVVSRSVVSVEHSKVLTKASPVTRLPQTGEKRASVLALVGVLLLAELQAFFIRSRH